MTFLNIIFLVTCYPIIFIMYFMLRNAKDKNSWCFGATLSRELKMDPAVEAIDAEYRKKLKTSMIVLGIVPILAFFSPYISIAFSIWMYWILVVCFLPEVLLARANKQVQELKKERGWQQESVVSYTDLKMASVPRKVKWIHFLPAFVMNVIPIVLSFVLFKEAGYAAYRICVITFAACAVLCFVCAVWTDRQKVTVVCEDSDINMNYARAKKQLWKKFWMGVIWIHTGFTWLVLGAMYIRETGMAWILWGTVGYGIVAIAAVAWLLKRMQEINRKYEKNRTIVDESDDDRHWPYGLLYYNPKDSHIMVENRMGTGTTMNVATGVGKGMYIFAALTLLIIPVASVWLIMLDFTPINTKVENETIICTHLSVEYEIPLEDIENYTIITDLPDMTKVSGNGMDHVLSGTFEIYREGMFETFLNPQNDLFIKIETEDEMYYISGEDDAETQKIIDELKK